MTRTGADVLGAWARSPPYVAISEYRPGRPTSAAVTGTAAAPSTSGADATAAPADPSASSRCSVTVPCGSPGGLPTVPATTAGPPAAPGRSAVDAAVDDGAGVTSGSTRSSAAPPPQYARSEPSNASV